MVHTECSCYVVQVAETGAATLRHSAFQRRVGCCHRVASIKLEPGHPTLFGVLAACGGHGTGTHGMQLLCGAVWFHFDSNPASFGIPAPRGLLPQGGKYYIRTWPTRVLWRSGCVWWPWCWYTRNAVATWAGWLNLGGNPASLGYPAPSGLLPQWCKVSNYSLVLSGQIMRLPPCDLRRSSAPRVVAMALVQT